MPLNSKQNNFNFKITTKLFKYNLIKTAMTLRSKNKVQSVPPIMSKMEIPTPHLVVPTSPTLPRSEPQPIAPSMPTSMLEINTTKEQPQTPLQDQPFFVRIDKFNFSKDSFENIDKKVGILEDIIQSLEKIREKEEKELEDWKIQVNAIKDLLSNVDKELFGKL